MCWMPLERAGCTSLPFSASRQLHLLVYIFSESTHHINRGKHREHEIRSIERDPEECRLGVQLLIGLDELIDLILALEVRNQILSTGNLLAVGEGGPDVVLQGGCFGRGACEVFALGYFDFHGFLGP